MKNRVCGIINGILAATSIGVCNFVHNRTEGNICFFLISAFIAVSVGCWKRLRWLVCLATAPILVASMGLVVIAATMPELFGSGQVGLVLTMALGVTALEIFSLFSVGKRSPLN